VRVIADVDDLLRSFIGKAFLEGCMCCCGDWYGEYSAECCVSERLKGVLVGMCEQYLTDHSDVGCREFGHDFMSAGEDACALLVELFPEEFVDSGRGCRRV